MNASLGRVFLYTESLGDSNTTVVNVEGLPITEATKRLIDAGLNIRLAGTVNVPEGGATYPKATAQSIAAGTTVPRGTVVTVRFLYDDKE